jgi:hypothetical protein
MPGSAAARFGQIIIQGVGGAHGQGSWLLLFLTP